MLGNVVASASVLLIVLLGGEAAAARFEVQQLAVEGTVKEVVAADLDGDGHRDLLVVYNTGLPPTEVRHFAVFWNNGKSFAGKPDLVAEAGADVCAFDVADLDGQPGDELLELTPEGVTTRSLRGRSWGSASSLVREPTFFFQPGKGELPRLRIVQDISAAESHDLIVPGLGVAAVYRHQGASYELAGRISVEMDGSLGHKRLVRDPTGIPGATLRYDYPAIAIADTDGDGKRDIVASLEDRLFVYRQQPDGSFAAKPSYARIFATRTAEEIKDAFGSAAIQVSDLDGDGIADLVVRKEVEHGLASAVTTAFVYFGRKDGTYPDKPDQTIKTSGASGIDAELLDLTGDGHPDLVIPSVKIGVWAVIRMLTSRSILITYQLYPFEPAHRRFASEPSSKRDLKFSLSLSGEADFQAIEERGDYNGDRKPDLAFATSDDELSIFPGIKGGEPFADDPTERVAVRAFGQAQAVDLDHQGKSDLILHYPNTKGHRGEVAVLRNRGPW